MSIDDENFGYSDDEIDEKKHQKLLDKVLSLNKAQQLKKPSRSEPTLKISEFDLVKSLAGKKGTVHLEDLTKVLKKKKSHINIKKKIENSTKVSRTLPKPLEKPVAERIKRAVAYEKARLELDRWEPIVTSNRVSTNLVFPLPSNEKNEKDDPTSRWRLKTLFDLEKEKKMEEYYVDVEEEKQKFTMSLKEIVEHRKEAAKLRAHQSYKEAKARRQNKIKSKKYHRLQKKQKIKQQLKEFELLQKTDPEEALKKLDEIEKIRAQERFSLRHKSTGKWAKNKQIRAKYDKESRQELAQQLTLSKELTQKIKNGSDSEDDINPVKDAELNITEKNNPWLDNFKVDKEVRDFVDSYRKFWLKKSGESLEESGETHEIEENNILDQSSERNGDDDVENTIRDTESGTGTSYFMKKQSNLSNQPNNDKNITKLIDVENNDEKITKKRNKVEKSKKINSKSTSEWDIEIVDGENIDAAFDKMEQKLNSKLQKKLKAIQTKSNSKKTKSKKKRQEDSSKKESLLALPVQNKRPKLDDALIENLDDSLGVGTDKDLNDLRKVLEKDVDTGKKKKDEANIDPNKWMNVKVTELETEMPDLSTNVDDDEEIEKESSQRDLIAEAFQDDDLIEEFAYEKSKEIEKDKPTDINLTLPGWGSWGGTGIVPSKRKQKRLTLKVPKKMPRRDDNKGFLIINEDASKKVKEHMVDELPFPFQRVKDFEASIRAPIGREFVPEMAFRKFTKPAVRTRSGTIIEPMNKDVLLKKTS